MSETMKKHSGENDQEKVKKRERRRGSETMLFLSKKAGKDQNGTQAEKGATRSTSGVSSRSHP